MKMDNKTRASFCEAKTNNAATCHKEKKRRGGIEPSTSQSAIECSTTELPAHLKGSHRERPSFPERKKTKSQQSETSRCGSSSSEREIPSTRCT